MSAATVVLLVLLAFAMPLATPLAAQSDSASPPREPYRVEVSGAVGAMASTFRERRSPLSQLAPVLGWSAWGRVMWHPGRLLSFGLASGYVVFTSEDFSHMRIIVGDTLVPSHATLEAVQLQAAVSMRKGGFEIGVAVGPYLMMSRIVDEDATHGERLELGLTTFASYEWTLTGRLHAGPSLRCIIMPYRGITSIIPELRVHYDLIVY